MKFPVLLDHDDKGTYGVVFPDLPGCVAVGKSADDALLNAEAVLRDWYECAIEHGDAMPTPSEPGDVRVPPGSTLASVRLAQPAMGPVSVSAGEG